MELHSSIVSDIGAPAGAITSLLAYSRATDMSEPIHLYILLGRSYMVGSIKIASEAQRSIQLAAKTRTNATGFWMRISMPNSGPKIGMELHAVEAADPPQEQHRIPPITPLIEARLPESREAIRFQFEPASLNMVPAAMKATSTAPTSGIAARWK